MSKPQTVAVPAVFDSFAGWVSAAYAALAALIHDATSIGEGLPHPTDTPAEGQDRARRKVDAPALTVPPMRFGYGFPSSQGMADDKKGLKRFARKRGELWEPAAAAVLRGGLSNAAITPDMVKKAEKAGTVVTALAHGPSLKDSSGRTVEEWLLLLSPRIGVGLSNAGARERAILATMLHYMILAGLGPAPLVEYPEGSKARKAFPRGRIERYGKRWAEVADLIGFAEPNKKENFDLREGLATTLDAMIFGSEKFPEPLGAFPEPFIEAVSLKRVGVDAGDITRNRKVSCPNRDPKAKPADGHYFGTCTRTFAEDRENPDGTVRIEVSPLMARCGKCNSQLTVEMPLALELYNESIRRKESKPRALLIASGQYEPDWVETFKKNRRTPGSVEKAAADAEAGKVAGVA